MDDILINFGSEVKAVGNGRVEGYLVRYGTPDDHDLVRDYFTKSTDFLIEDGARSPIYYGHGLDGKIGKRVLGYGTMKSDDVGVWFTGQMALRDDYERAVYGMVEAKKIGFSSGTASHLVEREETTATDGKKSFKITRWPLGLDASLTPTPCEPRGTSVTGMKTWQADRAEQDALDISEAVKSLHPSLTLSDEIDAALVAVENVASRARSANDLRIKSGRVLSSVTRAKLQSMHSALSDLLTATEIAPAAEVENEPSPTVDAPAETKTPDAPAETKTPDAPAQSLVAAALSAYVQTQTRLSLLGV